MQESLPEGQYHWSSQNSFLISCLKNKGSTVRHKPGRLFERNDFPSLYFKDNDFISHNKFGEGHFIVFPIYMYCHLKFVQQNYDSKVKTLPRCFTVSLSWSKRRFNYYVIIILFNNC